MLANGQRYFSRSLTMVVCAFNEEELIEEFFDKSVRDLSNVCQDWEIILINDGSTDRTSELAHRFARNYPQIRIFDQKVNRGPGGCIQLGFYNASKDYVFHNTVDMFFNTEDLTWVLPHLDKYESLSGYRSDLKANNPYQKLLTVCNRGLIRTLFPLKLRAYQTVQFHPRSLFEQIRIEGRSSFVAAELLIKAFYLGHRIGEIEVVFHPRTKGTAKGGGLKHVFRSMKDIWKFWFLWVVLKRPIANPWGANRPKSLRAPESSATAGKSAARIA